MNTLVAIIILTVILIIVLVIPSTKKDAARLHDLRIQSQFTTNGLVYYVEEYVYDFLRMKPYWKRVSPEFGSISEAIEWKRAYESKF